MEGIRVGEVIMRIREIKEMGQGRKGGEKGLGRFQREGKDEVEGN
jgi:hypothetical protein